MIIRNQEVSLLYVFLWPILFRGKNEKIMDDGMKCFYCREDINEFDKDTVKFRMICGRMDSISTWSRDGFYHKKCKDRINELRNLIWEENTNCVTCNQKATGSFHATESGLRQCMKCYTREIIGTTR